MPYYIDMVGVMYLVWMSVEYFKRYNTEPQRESSLRFKNDNCKKNNITLQTAEAMWFENWLLTPKCLRTSAHFKSGYSHQTQELSFFNKWTAKSSVDLKLLSLFLTVFLFYSFSVFIVEGMVAAQTEGKPCFNAKCKL